MARDFIAVKSVKAKGKRLTTFTIDHITELLPVPTDENEEEDSENENSDGSEENETAIEPDRSDDEVRDELTGQHRLF